jgi:PhzF family phenazine biosynthesis protein
MSPTPLRLEPRIHWLSVFGAGPGGGNPAPIMLDADGLSDARMREVACVAGHESGFVLRPAAGDDVDFEFRFWVPHHEMEMCGHVTVGAVWLLHRLGRLGTGAVRVRTRSGVVTARADARDRGGLQVDISQPRGHVDPLADPDVRAEILAVLRAPAEDLAPLPVQNASTRRVKTLVPMASIAAAYCHHVRND